MEKIRLGVIGFGNMGTGHCSMISGGRVPDMELAAICDTSPDRVAAAKAQYPSVAVFDNATDLYKSGLCDLVIIASPHYDHTAQAMEAFSYGLHVIVEKPAGVYTSQVLEMNAAAKESGKVFAIMYNQRTNPIYQKVREMVQSGKLGHIKRISWVITDWYRPQSYHDSCAWRSTWKTEGGGALINQNPHQLDLWQWMFGMPDKITSFVSFGKYYDIEVEDEVTAYFEYENGTTGTYITSTGETPGTNRLEIACDMGKIVVENDSITFDQNEISEREFNQTFKGVFGAPQWNRYKVPVDNISEQHVGIFKNVAANILRGEALLAPGCEGINGLTISNAIHYSAWTKSTVDVRDFPHEDFYNLLQEKIRNSTVDKSNTVQRTADTSDTY